ncbi:PhoH family protein [Candidatus Dependentiae bacterium]|nr:PhoH family protein [Candidatus Dependentiae bacterium]
MQKIFIIDTNVLLHDADSIFKFADNIVVIPMVVLEELDTFKKRMDEVGKNCRVVSRILDELRTEGTKLSEGAKLPNGGLIKVMLSTPNLDNLPPELRTVTADNRILSLAKLLKESGNHVILISKDLNMRLKADTLDIHAEDYEVNKVKIEELYSGVTKRILTGEQFENLKNNRKLQYESDDLYCNECVIISLEANESELLYCTYDKHEKMLRTIKYNNEKIWGIKPKNVEQLFALDLLLNDKIKLVTLVGFAGTGKTLLSLAVGLSKVLDENKYTKLLVSRPVIPLGKDIGYLPGDVYEKLMPRMQPISDNIEYLFKESNSGRIASNELENLIENGVIELEAVTYIRGRSIPEQFIIVDEAQNLTPHEIKTIITRVGTNTKIVLTGDPYQIDHPYLDSDSNGLAFLVERFKDQPLAGHITFRKGERSELAQLAAELLD